MAYRLWEEAGHAGRPEFAPAEIMQADLAPLDVSGYGTMDERKAGGDEIDPDELALMERALKENSVIVAQMTPFFD